MLWGTFTLTHIITLLLAIGINVGLYFILKNRKEKTQRLVLFLLSLTGIAAIVFNLVRWNSPLEYLPFHMCSITAMMLPFAVWTKNRAFSNLLLLWALGAVFALVVNNAQAEYELFSATFFFYYIPHLFEAGIPILMFALKLWKKDVRAIPSTVGITLGIYTVVHFINLLVNSIAVKNEIVDWAGNIIKVNYMYSINPDVPFMQLFWNIIPFQYFYMFCAIPIIVIYLALVYLPEIIKMMKARKNV